jgi:excinuclease ABC subunit C
MDGGRGQVNIALEVLKDLQINIPVCGMVKDDNHRTRGLYYNNEEIPIDKDSEAFKLLTRIQDEVHRFAIEYHRKLRGKELTRSVLDGIPGIGEKRKLALLSELGSVDAIKAASVYRLAEVPGMNLAAAESVHKYFAEKQDS